METPSNESVEVDYNYYGSQESNVIHMSTGIVQPHVTHTQDAVETVQELESSSTSFQARGNVDELSSDIQHGVDLNQQPINEPYGLCKVIMIHQPLALGLESDDNQFSVFSPSSSTDTEPLKCPFMPDVAIDVCPGPDNTSLFVNLEEVDVYRGKEYSSADTLFQHVDQLMNSLPDLVISKVFEYLYWKEKIYATEVFPCWKRVLHSLLGWELFENDRGYAHCYEPLVSNHFVLEELACIAQYGQYFSRCIIWIHNFLPIDSPVDTDFSILRYISLHCTSIKSLSIYHPPNLSSSALTLSYIQYIAPLQNVLSSDRRVCLHMYRLLYSSVESSAGVLELLNFYSSHNILKKLTTLDFSHGLILAGSIHPLNSLINCTSLQVLKCPIQNVTTAIIQQLLARQLQDLFLVNDEHTLNLNYVEKGHIRWAILNLRPGRIFNVHYIFKNRTVCPVNLCPNPFIHSLVLDSLCSSVSRALLRYIADTYSRTLRCLAFILSVWEPLVPFSDLEDLANNFQYLGKRLVNLQSIILNLIVPCDALLALAQNTPQLKHLLVYQHKIFYDGKTAVTEEQLMDLQQEISAGLKRSWAPVMPEESLYRLGSSSHLALLFEESVNQWEGFW